MQVYDYGIGSVEINLDITASNSWYFLQSQLPGLKVFWGLIIKHHILKNNTKYYTLDEMKTAC